MLKALNQSIAVGDQLLPHYSSNDRKQQQGPSESAKSEITATLHRVSLSFQLIVNELQLGY
jgi:hypothetical protein